MKRVYNDVRKEFEEVAKNCDLIKPKKMEISSKLHDITEDDNILQFKDNKIGLIHLKDLQIIREIEFKDVTAIHASDEGDMYWIARGKGEIAIYDSAELTLKKTIPPFGAKIIEIKSDSQYAVFVSELGTIYIYDYNNLGGGEAIVLHQGLDPEGVDAKNKDLSPLKNIQLAKGYLTGVWN